MLSEQEIMNYELKDMQLHEENMANKYANISGQINDPKLKQSCKVWNKDLAITIVRCHELCQSFQLFKRREVYEY